MEFSFDIHGYLKPYGKVITDLDSCSAGFVEPFEPDSTRHQLFQGYVSYNEDLKQLLGSIRYAQWIDGSFISTKVNPADIDLVSFIDHQIVDQHETDLARFIAQTGKETYGVDAYIVRMYPEEHPYYIRTQSDLVYWEHWFSQSMKNRRKRRFPKGFLEITY
ncbi:MAG: hypothetical protein D6722_05395 [Bacteroidetes bacterium]|nr:MAG: hypothetical protein D6722_05395 [Bacteroidota bacterium]